MTPWFNNDMTAGEFANATNFANIYRGKLNNLRIEYSVNVWSGIRDPGNFIPDVHVHLIALVFNLL